MHDSAQILAIKLGAWKKEITAVRDWYANENSNLVEVDGERSKWWVWNKALEIGKQSVVQIQAYLQRVSEGECTFSYIFTWLAALSLEMCWFYYCTHQGLSAGSHFFVFPDNF